MARLREIRKRIKAVANIQRITKTMQMIATAKFQAAIRRAQATKPFTSKINEIATELAAAGGDDLDHPLLHPPANPARRELVLIITSNRGLCGAYNSSLLRTATALLRSLSGTQVELEVVGKKGVAYFRFAGVPAAKTHVHFTDKPKFEEIEALANDYIARFEKGEFDAVHVVYTQFVSNSKQVARVARLLPLERPKAEAAKKTTGIVPVYEFLPDPAYLLGKLLPLTVKTQLFQFFNDAIVSEQIARMVAMKSATDNAGKMVRGLRRQFNRARQAQITKELIEIVSGASALN
jgi:F-type H+-transporting ATPase subunit gamma